MFDVFICVDVHVMYERGHITCVSVLVIDDVFTLLMNICVLDVLHCSID